MAKNELTVTQAAERLNVAAITVRKWCKRGLFPNAYMHETLLGALWMIPESDVKNFQPPTIGRPPKPKASGTDGKVNVKPGKRGSKK
jgi:excisionase family DNA binding protein